MAHDRSSDTVPERIARLEEQMEGIKDIKPTLDELKLELSRYKGFVGGILFLLSCIAAFIKGIPVLNSFFNR